MGVSLMQTVSRSHVVFLIALHQVASYQGLGSGLFQYP